MYQTTEEEAEHKRLAAELDERRRRRILWELEEAPDLVEDTEKHKIKVTKQSVMERAMSDKRKEHQETEKKLEKLVKTMDYLERAKREEAAHLIEAAYQQRLVEERELYEQEQQPEVERSRERHERDLMERNRLLRMSDNKELFKESVISIRRAEEEERIRQVMLSRKQERDNKRKQIYYLKLEEERIKKLQEEEARMREEAEKRRKEEAEQKARLDEIAEMQRKREDELEEKERLRQQDLLRPSGYAWRCRSAFGTSGSSSSSSSRTSQC